MAESNGTYRVQYAALPYRLRQDGEVQLRLVTSRETRRWVIPKGWPMKGTPPHKAAAREAYEEAGLLGSISSTPIGIYRYDKRLSATRSVLCEVMVFPMKVKRYLKKWPERAQRVGFWFSIETAASVVQEPELASLILEFGAVMAERQAQKQAKAEAAARAKAEEDKPARAAPKKKAAPKKVAAKADADDTVLAETDIAKRRKPKTAAGKASAGQVVAAVAEPGEARAPEPDQAAAATPAKTVAEKAVSETVAAKKAASKKAVGKKDAIKKEGIKKDLGKKAVAKEIASDGAEAQEKGDATPGLGAPGLMVSAKPVRARIEAAGLVTEGSEPKATRGPSLREQVRSRRKGEKKGEDQNG